MSGHADAGVLLERALLGSAEDAGVALRIAAADWQRWASVTFTGARHALLVEAERSAKFDHWLAQLDEHTFELRGHVVADLHIVGRARDGGADVAEIEALTVES